MDALLQHLFPSLHALLKSNHPAPASRPAHTMAAEVRPEPAEPPMSCGWFDSSHELNCGLCVQELVTPEALASALPLSIWLELELAASARQPC